MRARLALVLLAAACGPAAPAPAPAPAPPPPPPKDEWADRLPKKAFTYDVETPPAIEFVGARGGGPALAPRDAVLIHYIATAGGKRIGGTVPDALAGTRTPFEPLPADPAARAAAPRPFGVELGRERVVLGLDRGLLAMRVGDHAKILARSDLAYGNYGFGEVVPSRTDVQYEVWVIEKLPPLAWDTVKAGDGERVTRGATLRIHLVVTLPDGTVVDDTRRGQEEGEPGAPFEFHAGVGETTVEALDRIVLQLRGGDRVRARVPWFFDQGPEPRTSLLGVAIPAMTELTYDIEILEVKKP